MNIVNSPTLRIKHVNTCLISRYEKDEKLTRHKKCNKSEKSI